MNKLILFPFLAALIGCALGQGKGTFDPEFHWPLNWFDCTSGACLPVVGQLVIDANWRWTHKNNDFNNCYTGNTWDTSACPDGPTCAANCQIDGITQEKWTKTYGIDNGNDQQKIRFQFVTQDTYGTTIGGRIYLMEDKSK